MTESKPKKAAVKKEAKETVKPNTANTTTKAATKEFALENIPYFAVIRLRGQVRINKSIKDTLTMLNIKQRNHCSLQKITPVTKGMIMKVKDYITWGEADEETIKLLIEKRKEINEKGEMKKTFRLSPPRGGFERKGTKKGFKEGGALGYRGAKINDLIKKMI